MTRLRTRHRLPVLLSVSRLPKSTFFYQLARQQAADKYAEVKALIVRLSEEHRSLYGYRRMGCLLRQHGWGLSGKTVLKLMSALGLQSPVRKKRYRSCRGPEGRTAGNVLQRNFRAQAPNEKWVTDVTEFSVAGEKCYLSPVLDLYNGEIVGWETARKPLMPMINNMLSSALRHLTGEQRPLLHSDQGWQYQMPEYRQRLAENGIKQSMSRRGNCLDNAVMENFFGHLKSEMFYLKKYRDVEELEKDIGDYIHFWNTKRIKMGLGGLSPVAYRTQHYAAL